MKATFVGIYLIVELFFSKINNYYIYIARISCILPSLLMDILWYTIVPVLCHELFSVTFIHHR
jgi:hypothetical protein